MAQPELIGRDAEMVSLGSVMEAALIGKGSTIFISGEAGVGKTRLVSELIRKVDAHGFRVIEGRCLAESLEPLMPIRNALKNAGLLHLASGDPPPLLISSYLFDNSGILIAGSENNEMGLDMDIFSSMLKAVGDFVKDSMRLMDGTERTGGLNTLGYGEFKIIIEEEQGLHLACITKGGFNEQLVTDMRDVLKEIWATHRDMLENWSGDTDGTSGIEQFVSRLVGSGKYTGQFLVADPKLKQENLFDNVLLGLQRASSEAPLMIFLDDLQWADPTTLKLLHFLSRNIRANNIIMICAYRPEDVTSPEHGKAHPLERAMQDMGREGLFEEMKLDRLDAECTGRMICSALHDLTLDREFLALVHTETGGTPLFVMEVLKLLADEGVIARSGSGRWEIMKELDGLELPTKVFDVVKRRLDRLNRDERGVLECASVMGDEFTLEILLHMTGMDKVALLRTVAYIESAHKLIHSSGKLCRFDHTNIREILYQGIMEELRGEYHRMVADALSGSTPQPVNELAHHYHRARDPRAGKYLLRAGDMARERYSNQEAINAYTDALSYIAEGERFTLLETLGDLLALVGNYDSSLESFDEAMKSARTTEARSRTLRKIGEIHMNRGEFNKALNTLDSADSRVGEETGEHAKILFTRGCVHQRKGENEKALEVINDSLSIFERFGDFKGIGDAYRIIGTIYWNNGDYEQAMLYFGKSLTMMEEMRDDVGIASALGNMGIVHWNRGELDRALECYGRSLGISEKIGNRSGTGANLANLGLLYWEKGELQRSLEFQERSLRLFELMGDQRGIATVLGNISLLHRDNGDLELALENQKLSFGMRERMGDRAGMALALGSLAELQADLGNLEGATEHFKHSQEICQGIGDRRVSIHNLCGMAEVSLFKSDIESALSNAQIALKLSIELGARSEEVMSHRILGMSLREMGRHDEAGSEFELAENVLKEIGDRKEMARLLYEQALLCRAKNDMAGANRHMEAAVSEFDRMGMKLWAERSRREMERFSSPK